MCQVLVIRGVSVGTCELHSLARAGGGGRCNPVRKALLARPDKEADQRCVGFTDSQQ